jgi:hypothetical protein
MGSLSLQDFFVCQDMRTKNPKKHRNLQPTGDIQTCLLCARPYCEAHKSQGADGVCEVNHATYYSNHRGFPNVFPSLDARNRELAKVRP